MHFIHHCNSAHHDALSEMFLMMGGVGWFLTYITAIIIGFKHKSYAIPAIALFLNFAWEFNYGFIEVPCPHSMQTVINKIWTGLDAIIVFTFIKYGRKYIPTMFQKLFIPNLIVGLLVCWIFQYSGYKFFHLPDIPYPSGVVAFIMNLLMSVLFINMLVRRNSTEGQSMYLALFKMLGTLVTSIALTIGTKKGIEVWDRAGFVIPFLATATFVYDVAYIFLLQKMFKKENVNGWKYFSGNPAHRKVAA